MNAGILNKKQLTVGWVMVSLFLINICAALAHPDLKVEGIIYEEKEQSYAIVNGRIVKVGNKIEGAEIVEIGKDSVKFRYGDVNFIKSIEGGGSKKQQIIPTTYTKDKELLLEFKKKIFYEACEAENRAIREAKAKHPFSGTLNKEEAGNRSEMSMNLMKKYRKEVWDKYNISEDQGIEIGAEGIENHWPQPPWESPW